MILKNKKIIIDTSDDLITMKILDGRKTISFDSLSKEDLIFFMALLRGLSDQLDVMINPDENKENIN